MNMEILLDMALQMYNACILEFKTQIVKKYTWVLAELEDQLQLAMKLILDLES